MSRMTARCSCWLCETRAGRHRARSIAAILAFSIPFKVARAQDEKPKAPAATARPRRWQVTFLARICFYTWNSRARCAGRGLAEDGGLPSAL